MIFNTYAVGRLGETVRHSTSYHRKASLCDSTLYQVEVGPVKKRSDSVERSTRKEEWIRIEGPI